MPGLKARTRPSYSPARPLSVPPACRCLSQGWSNDVPHLSSPHEQIHGLSISNNCTPLHAICTENTIEHELLLRDLMKGCVPASRDAPPCRNRQGARMGES